MRQRPVDHATGGAQGRLSTAHVGGLAGGARYLSPKTPAVGAVHTPAVTQPSGPPIRGQLTTKVNVAVRLGLTRRLGERSCSAASDSGWHDSTADRRSVWKMGRRLSRA